MTEQTTPAPQEYSLTELDNAVVAGQITQTQRDQIWSTQIERKAMEKATTAATQIVETHARENSLDTQLQQYAEMAPDVVRDGSPLRQRVASEFEFLVSQGLPRNLTTELAAVRAVMGPVERMRQSQRGRPRGPDYMSDTHGSSSLSPRERRAEDAWQRLDPSRRSHYEKLVNNGVYGSKEEVLKELSWRRGSGNRGRA